MKKSIYFFLSLTIIQCAEHKNNGIEIESNNHNLLVQSISHEPTLMSEYFKKANIIKYNLGQSYIGTIDYASENDKNIILYNYQNSILTILSDNIFLELKLKDILPVGSMILSISNNKEYIILNDYGLNMIHYFDYNGQIIGSKIKSYDLKVSDIIIKNNILYGFNNFFITSLDSFPLFFSMKIMDDFVVYDSIYTYYYPNKNQYLSPVINRMYLTEIGENIMLTNYYNSSISSYNRIEKQIKKVVFQGFDDYSEDYFKINRRQLLYKTPHSIFNFLPTNNLKYFKFEYQGKIYHSLGHGNLFKGYIALLDDINNMPNVNFIISTDSTLKSYIIKESENSSNDSLFVIEYIPKDFH